MDVHIRWHSGLSVGVPDIDEQHQELFRRADALLDALRDSRGQHEIDHLIPFLHTYVDEHFAAEERLMASHVYPRAAEHGAQHKRLVDELLEFERKLREGGATAAIAVELSQFLGRWLDRHITMWDQILGAFLLAREGRRAFARSCGAVRRP